MIGRVRVVVYYAAPEETLVDAYERVNKEMAGTAGLVGAELLKSTLDTDRFAVLSEWTDLPSFSSSGRRARGTETRRPSCGRTRTGRTAVRTGFIRSSGSCDLSAGSGGGRPVGPARSAGPRPLPRDGRLGGVRGADSGGPARKSAE
ncbi:antibiotic biosynthesis monooxygenase family protein [Fodinicola feengrottensis]|uniref:antibiotic biosynthesis monooxygenase family protein n=1 Tax=Fodinicola feengrottensis TaxID=435914 RepID=UPI0013D117B1|nr:antibiotic biosynthesis monooxygenase [Fodinicola feengrottensis]